MGLQCFQFDHIKVLRTRLGYYSKYILKKGKFYKETIDKYISIFVRSTNVNIYLYVSLDNEGDILCIYNYFLN